MQENNSNNVRESICLCSNTYFCVKPYLGDTKALPYNNHASVRIESDATLSIWHLVRKHPLYVKQKSRRSVLDDKNDASCQDLSYERKDVTLS